MKKTRWVRSVFLAVDATSAAQSASRTGGLRRVNRVIPARRLIAGALAGVCAAGFVLTCGACTHASQPAQTRATLKPAPEETGVCSPDRLVRCVPGLADVEDKLFSGVGVYGSDSDAAALPPSAARDAAPKDCQELPKFGAKDRSELDVDYRPATDANGKPIGDRFSANGGQYVHVRFAVTGAADDLANAMAAWTNRCSLWGVAETMTDNGIQGWLVAESSEGLQRYQAGDVDGQWSRVTDMAATVLPNGVIMQAWYRTTDPSAASRNHVLSQLLGAAGRPRPRSALPPKLADWSQAQISTLLPPLAIGVGVKIGASEQDGHWSLCPSDDQAPSPLDDRLASWRDSAPSKGDRADSALFPNVTINRARAGVDYLADLRREIATCAAHLADRPALCGDRDARQSLNADSAVAEGEDTVRITHRWLRVEKVQGYDRCVEGIEALRIAQVRGLIVTSSTSDSSAKQKIGDPPLPLGRLDELLAETVRSVKAA
jgi:hypothetical protein